MTVSEMEKLHPRSVRAGYDEIGRTLASYDFVWIQGSVYHCINEDLANLANALRALPWFPASVRDIHAFRVEQWSNFTTFIQS